MKIAIIYQHISFGGGIRFFKSLVKALVKKYDNLTINVYADSNFIKDEKTNSFFSDLTRVNLIPLKEERFSVFFLRKILRNSRIVSLFFKILKHLGLGVSPVLSKETIDEINKHDLLYLPWPFYLKPCNINIPVFGTFHDFNYMHPYFGNFGKIVARVLNRETSFWLKKSPCPIVSSEFIKSEIDKFYPFVSKKTKVIHVSTFIFNEKENLEYLSRSFNAKNYPCKYVLYPSNTAFHKNHINLFKAFGILKKNNISLPLLLSGYGTEDILRYYNTKKLSFGYYIFKRFVDALRKNDLIPGEDVFMSGYVSDDDIYGLIKHATLVVSPTLYEAGSGPGLDAWHIGTPVAFSNIPPHLNHMDFLKTQAWTFDPKDPEDIASTIEKALFSEREKSLKMVEVSKENIQKYTWNNIAEQYYTVFKNNI